MVGAGFSRNGVPATASARPFPTWPQLTKLLSAALYPEADQSEIATGTSGALRLAQEFEAVFGRFRLEEVIRGAVPDAGISRVSCIAGYSRCPGRMSSQRTGTRLSSVHDPACTTGFTMSY